MITMESDRKSLGCGAALVVAAGLGLALSGVPTPAFAQEVSVQEDIDLAAAASASTLGDAGKTSLEVKSTVDEGGLPKSPTAPKHMATSNATGFDSATGEDEASELTQNAAASEKAEMPAEAVKPESGAKEASKIEATSKDELAGTTENSAEITAASKTEADAKADADKAVTAESSAPAAAKASSAPRDAWVGDSYYDGSGRRVESGWVVSANRSDPKAGLERYWIRDGRVFRGGLFEADAKAGWWAYAKSDGSVVRGRYAVGGRVYLADNDGRLWSRGWHVTGELTGGALERYYVEADHAARVGYSASGYAHYTRADGTVLRGRTTVGDRIYLADNDGRLGGSADRAGWAVTGAYTGGALQRYWFEAGNYVKAGYSSAGWAHFSLADGSVMRGKLSRDGVVLIADNDGRLATGAGWRVTGAYDGGELQRYWLVEVSGHKGFYGAKTGSFSVGGDRYYGREDTGYVVRGSYVAPNGLLIVADNDGKIYANLNGIDIASWQNGIDLSKVPADFVLVKATQGTNYTFSAYRQYADQALALGKKLGFYHFVDTSVSAEAQADYFVNAVRPYLGRAVLVLDWENNDMTGRDNLSAGPDFAKRFLDRVRQQTGVTPMIYTSRSVVHEYNWSGVANAGYKLWVAQYPYKYYDPANGYNGYAKDPTTISFAGHSSSDFGAWGSKPTIWQYTSTGKLPGWGGQLDLNVFFGSSSDWDALARRA